MPTTEVKLYFAYTSPYSYLAMEPAFALEQSHQVTLRMIPHGISIRGVYGNVDQGEAHALRKVRYLYQDARRFARERGLTILGPKKIYNTRTCIIGGLYVDRFGKLRDYAVRVLERFFRRELDVEDRAAITALMREVGVDPTSFEEFAASEGPALMRESFEKAERDEIFGVPTFVVEGERFWGHDRIEWVIKKLDGLRLRR